MSYRDEEKRAAHVALAGKELLPYATYIDPSYQTPEHVRLEAGYLEAVEAGRIRRIIFILPFQHGKSELISGKFPAWYLGKHNEHKIMLVGHTATLVETFSQQNRDTIADNPRYREAFPNVRLRQDRRSAGLWAINKSRESMITSGFTGGIAGWGCNGLIIDDPIKTWDQAQSPTYKERVWNEYLTAARSRVQPDGFIIIVSTRWAKDDLVGRLLEAEKDGGDKWVVVHLPALSYGVPEDYGYGEISEEDYREATKHIPKTAFPDTLSRHKDEPLWPQKFNKDYLLRTKAVMQYRFECAYQGNPGAPEGNKFKKPWFRSITQETIQAMKLEKLAQVRSWDLAWSAKDSADNTAGLKATLYKRPAAPDTQGYDSEAAALGVTNKLPPVLIVLEWLDVWQEEWDVSSERILARAVEDTPAYEILIEAIASQNIGFKSLRKDKRLTEHTIIPITKGKGEDKETYAKPAMRFGSLGLFFLLYPSASVEPEWVEPFLEELGLFPNGDRDDRVDTLSMIVNRWAARIDELLMEAPANMWQTPFNDTTVLAKLARMVLAVKNPELLQIFHDDTVEKDNPFIDGMAW